MNIPDVFFEEYWGILNAANDGGDYFQYVFEDENGIVLHPFVKRPTRLLPATYDILSPTGFSGPIVIDCREGRKEELIRNFDRGFQTYCETNGIVAEYVRFSPWLKNHQDFGSLYELKHHGYTYGIDLTKDYFNDEFNSSRRCRIARAENAGVKVGFDFSGETIAEFYRLYQMMYAKNNPGDIEKRLMLSNDYMADMVRLCRGHMFIANAFIGRKTISSTVYLYSGKYLHSYLTGNDPEFYDFNANSVVISKACEWGRKTGKVALQQGGARNEGIAVFKKQFTQKCILDFHVGYRVRQNALYERLVAIRGEANKAYFPAYRE